MIVILIAVIYFILGAVIDGVYRAKIYPRYDFDFALVLGIWPAVLIWWVLQRISDYSMYMYRYLNNKKN